MIRGSRFVLSVCAVTALGLHGAGFWVSHRPAGPEIEGGAGAPEVLLGSSFADLVAGAAQPVSDTPVTPSVTAAEVLRPTKPDGTEAQAVRPQKVQAVAKASEALQMPVVPSAPTVTAATPATPATKDPAPAPASQPSVAQPKAETGLEISKRPKARPTQLTATATPRAAPKPDRKTAARATSGSNADQTATRGSMTGHETATAATEGRPKDHQSKTPGTAATSNYPGQVMRHLARVPRPRADTRGVALVQFSISEGGRLASVRVARSSGSTRLDRAALTVVERAAPFPAPPAGAQRSFSVQIKGE
ncbi:TonB family protein [Roseovarius mucosus]|uniref:energy transducer TonB n=1 Tax=Roseovarius mucosus TaxID=215743 RepID=UPI003BAD49B7